MSLKEQNMTNLEAIRQMNIEELAFFLCATNIPDPNDIPNITNEDIQYYKEYLSKEDGEGVLEATRELISQVR